MSTKNKNLGFWASCWENNATAWHLSKLNPALSKFGEKFLGTDPNTTVFFPLCGATLDMTILAPNFKVSGLEGVPQALEAYAEDNDSELVEVKSPVAEFTKFTCNLPNVENKPTVDLYMGDLFAATPDTKNLPQFDRVFDRGSFVAIKPNLRKEYVAAIDAMLKPGGKWMIASMDYDQKLYGGPPHALGPVSVQKCIDELEQTTDVKYELEVWENVDALETNMQTRFLKKNGGPLPNFNDYVMVLTKLEKP